ncbi:hypothetical protein [uncultured Algibacter sp.]|uniref:hypothetical protein n=1 Tax=uncultured Algibacter sp. TaxID=298659 RepID=UPI003216FC5F
MKSIILKVFVAVFLGNLFYSCDDESQLPINNSQHKTSLNQWQSLKQDHGDSYSYEIKTESVFGFGSLTKIIVKNNIPVSRVFESYNLYDNDTYLGWENRIITNEYRENINQLNTNNIGAAALTIDDLYALCLKDYLSVDANSNSINFNVDDSGLIKDCYYIPNGCQDDCLFGIQITNFKWIINTCNVSNPIENLAWLKEKTQALEVTPQEMLKYVYVSEGEYMDNTVYIFADCCQLCNSVYIVYNCEGNTIGIIGNGEDFISPSILENGIVIWNADNSSCF